MWHQAASLSDMHTARGAEPEFPLAYVEQSLHGSVEDTKLSTNKQHSLSCIYSPATSRFYEIEFAQTSVIACLQLDPTTASCAYVVDSNMYIVRGFSRTGRRLLSISEATYTSLDAACRDALVSEALPHTRAACQANFHNSRATLEILGLERQLPACSFCSLTDAIEQPQQPSGCHAHA
jgi:hypothetical protein